MIIYYNGLESNFYPLDLFRHQAKLLIGTTPFWKRHRGMFLIPDWLKPIYARARCSGTCLYLKATTLFLEKLSLRGGEVILKTKEGAVVGFRITKKPYPENGDEIKERLKKIREKKIVRAVDFNYPWELICRNGEIITRDFHKPIIPKGLKKKVEILGKHLAIRSGVKFDPNVLLDVRDGPVIIDKNVEIRAGSVVEGPAYIGPDTVIDGARIRPGTSVGRDCRISGEVEASIILHYSNKHHEGFLGHSYLGSWVNLGALTTNSDLKNNYHNVKVRYKDVQFDTGVLKFGCLIGDHVKTGIGILIPTGGVIGPFTSVFGGGMIENFVPSFMWGSPGDYQDYEINEAIETAKIVMSRRGIRLTKGYENVIRAVLPLERQEKKVSNKTSPTR